MFPKRFPPAAALGCFGALLLLFCIVYYHNEIFWGPHGIHDWAQSDRLALAIGYYDDGMKFFRPSTLSEWSKERVSGVEMPLQAYAAALIAKLTGRETLGPVLRLVTLGICWLGAIALFKAVFKLTGNFWVSAATPLLLLCSPVTIAYSASFLPDAAALWLFLVGIACLLSYFQNDQPRTLASALAWMSVAAIVKTTLVLYLLPIAIWLGLDRLRCDGRAFLRTSWLPLTVAVAGFMIIAAWYLHAQALNRTYESTLFLAAAQPFADWNEVKTYFNYSLKKQWLREYFVQPQYGILPVLLAIGLPFTTSQKFFEHRLNWLMVMCNIGTVAAFCTMGRQLYVHDYYILSIAYPLVAVLILVACIRLHSMTVGVNKRASDVLRSGLIIAVTFCFFFADFQYNQRTSNDYPPHTTNGQWSGSWQEGGAALLKNLGVPDTARIIIAEDDPPNRGLVHFDRKGVHLSEAVYGRGLEVAYRLARERGIRYVIFKRERYEAALHDKDSSYANRFELLTPDGDKMVLRVRDMVLP